MNNSITHKSVRSELRISNVLRRHRLSPLIYSFHWKPEYEPVHFSHLPASRYKRSDRRAERRRGTCQRRSLRGVPATPQMSATMAGSSLSKDPNEQTDQPTTRRGLYGIQRRAVPIRAFLLYNGIEPESGQSRSKTEYIRHAITMGMHDSTNRSACTT
jgi:hypothetical protein